MRSDLPGRPGARFRTKDSGTHSPGGASSRHTSTYGARVLLVDFPARGDEQVRADASVETRIRAGAGIRGRPTVCCSVSARMLFLSEDPRQPEVREGAVAAKPGDRGYLLALEGQDDHSVESGDLGLGRSEVGAEGWLGVCAGRYQ